MATRRGRYNSWNVSKGDFDVIHHETRMSQVKTVNASGVVTGDLNDVVAGINNDIETVDGKVGNLGSLATTNKSNVVSAINELRGSVADANNDIGASEGNITALAGRMTTAEGRLNALDSHNHDTRYLQLSGGTLTGALSMSNNRSFSMRNSAGTTDVNIGRVDASNQVHLGDATTGVRTIIGARNGELSVNTGSATHRVFHAGHMGAGSGLDADLLDGINGATYARRDQANTLTGHQTIGGSGNLNLNGGSAFFRDSSGAERGSIRSASNRLNFHAGTVNAFSLTTGGAYTEFPIQLNSANRTARVAWQRNASDAGVDLYMNQENFGMSNARMGTNVFRLNFEQSILNMTNGLQIQGRRVWIQTSAPTSAQANTGDIWFDI